MAGAIEALTNTAAAKRAAKAAATWFWMLVLVMLSFLLVQLGVSQLVCEDTNSIARGVPVFENLYISDS
tara:strand:- start:131 stop:337 length:207 start_codon:yes stop_codon:yes gene_type:complete